LRLTSSRSGKLGSFWIFWGFWGFWGFWVRAELAVDGRIEEAG
jgi:hypothetical protein